MQFVPVIAFLGLGPTELIVIALLALLLFGPRAARAMGSMGRTVLNLKREVDDTKAGLRRQVKRQVDDVLRGPKKKPKKADKAKPVSAEGQGEQVKPDA